MSKYPIPLPIFDTLEELKNCHLPANNKTSFALEDFKATLDFLKQYAGNKATFESYRREIERLLQWAWLIAEKSLLLLKRSDIEAYLAFCLNPPKSWIALKRTPRFIIKNGQRLPNSQWRPFVVSVSKSDHKKEIKPDKNQYHPSQKSIQEIFTVLNSFYNFLLIEEKVTVNPVALIRQKSKYLQKQQTQSPVMLLSEKQWKYCLEVIQEMADQETKHERTLFIISSLYLMYLRISELVASQRWIPLMKHFYQDSQENWWFKTVGKGNKLRDITVSDSMLAALKRYRKSLDLSPLPSPNEQHPLLLKAKGKGPVTSTRNIRRLVQECFDMAVDKLRKTGYSDDANILETATVHWLRHTGISDDINKRQRPIIHVRDDAGHSSSATTDRYNNSKWIERHRSGKHKKLSG